MIVLIFQLDPARRRVTVIWQHPSPVSRSLLYPLALSLGKRIRVYIFFFWTWGTVGKQWDLSKTASTSEVNTVSEGICFSLCQHKDFKGTQKEVGKVHFFLSAFIIESEMRASTFFLWVETFPQVMPSPESRMYSPLGSQKVHLWVLGLKWVCLVSFVNLVMEGFARPWFLFLYIKP